MSKLGPISYFPSPVSCDLFVLHGLRCEWGAGVLNVVLSLSHSLILVTVSSTWDLMTNNCLRLWKKRIVAPHNDGLGYRKINNTLKLSCSTLAKIIQRFNRTGSIQKDRTNPWSTREVECMCSAPYPEVVFGTYECCRHCCRGWRGGRSTCQCSEHTPHTASNWSACLSS